jgi:hypothetical protein
VLLTERDQPDSESPAARRLVAVPPASGAVASFIRLEGGFKPGRIWLSSSIRRDPIVVALGMAGIRDLMAYLSDHPRWRSAPPQKRATSASAVRPPDQDHALRGLHVDEDGKPAFDGAFIHVAGAAKAVGYRFAMPTRHFSVLGPYPTDFLPFATTTARDAVTGAEGSLLIGPARSASFPSSSS